MASAPVLHAPNLAVDACVFGAGAVLIQVAEDGVNHPVSYFSKKLSSCQQCYATVEKEALALIMAVQHFEIYLGSQPVVIYTDHNPLVFLHKMKNHNQIIMRCL